MFASKAIGQLFFNFLMTFIVNPNNSNANVEIFENNQNYLYFNESVY
jgi:hypothetical protein